MGSQYRSQHELIFLYKHGTAPHINNIQLGANGRYRTNVLEYAGANTFRAGRDQELERHPTPKPVALIADLIRDASHINDWVLDCFVGGGTIFIAAEKTRRRAAGIEIDPLYCDLSIERWQTLTGEAAVLLSTGQTFAEVAEARLPASAADELPGALAGARP
jgi:DNA modification methylase